MTPILDVVFVVCSEKWSRSAVLVFSPVGVIPDANLKLSWQVLDKVGCADLSKSQSKSVQSQED